MSSCTPIVSDISLPDAKNNNNEPFAFNVCLTNSSS